MRQAKAFFMHEYSRVGYLKLSVTRVVEGKARRSLHQGKMQGEGYMKTLSLPIMNYRFCRCLRRNHFHNVDAKLQPTVM